MTAPPISVDVVNDKGVLTAPYHPHLPKRAKALGGRFYGESWVFDARDDASIHQLADSIWGTTGTVSDLVTVQIETDEIFSGGEDSWWLFGRKIASRNGRDEPVRLGDGVVILKGTFQPFGGSIKNYCIGNFSDGMILELRDVPQKIVKEEDGIKIVGSLTDFHALSAEREKRVKRIVEIDEMLAASGEK